MAKREEPGWRKPLKRPREGNVTVRIVARFSDGGTIVVDLEDADKKESLRIFETLGITKTVELAR